MRDPGLRSQHRAELQVGVLVLAAAGALVAGVLWITGADVGGGRYQIHAVTPQAAQVSEGSRVYLRGVDVGSVRGVQLTERGAVLRLEVSDRVSLPRDSRAVIQPSGFLGTQMVELVPGAGQARLAAGDTLSARPAPDLQSIAAQLGDRAETFLDRASRAFSDSTVRALESGAGDLSRTLGEVRRLMEEERRTISSLLASLEQASAGLERATSGPELERIVTRIDILTEELARAGESLDASSRSLASILEKADRGEGSLGKLVNDDRLYEDLSATLRNLQAASEEITLLTRDVRRQPERYLRELKFSVF